MTRKRIIEGTWSCTSCDQKGLPGRTKICPACGNPRENAEMSFAFAANAPTVTDAAGLELANAGADWFCARCDTGNRGDEVVCKQCGANRHAEPPRPAPRSAAPVEVPRAVWQVPLGLALFAAAVVVLCCGGLGLRAWQRRDLEVDAWVAARTWVREVRVQRLTMGAAETWEDRLPDPAGLPGSGALAPGRGQILGCETLDCWPRPPDGATLARVTGRSWTHAISTRRLEERSAEGWDDQVPMARGSLPVNGEGGAEGLVGAPSCSSREREPERCHTETHREACGSHEVCTTRDLGNGFAEETCSDVTDYCSRDERICTPAVRDDWCSWKTWTWATGRSVERSGQLDAPVWPELRPEFNESVARTATYRVTATSLAGPALGGYAPATPEALRAHDPGELVFVRGADAQRVPAHLVPPDDDRVDCQDGVPFDVLATRRSCRYEHWNWVDEPPLEARGHDAAPAWPDGRLGDDGREDRAEWALLDLTWERGEGRGSRQVRIETARWEVWPVGAEVPVVVDREARFVRFPEGEPK